MTIKDIIKSSALLMGRREIYTQLNGSGSPSEEVSDSISTLTGLTNLVINELSSTYIPLVKEEVVSATSDRIGYDRFSEKVLKVREVFNMYGIKIPFKEEPTYLDCGDSKVTAIYEYTPKEYTIDETIGYTEKQISKRVLAYGLCAEFSISEGRFDEAVTWHKRYVDALSEICLPENAYIKARRFM